MNGFYKAIRYIKIGRKWKSGYNEDWAFRTSMWYVGDMVPYKRGIKAIDFGIGKLASYHNVPRFFYVPAQMFYGE